MSELQGNPPKVKEAVVLCSCRKGTRVATELETPGHENKVTCLSNCTTAIGITVKYVAETRNPAKPLFFFLQLIPIFFCIQINTTPKTLTLSFI